MWKAIRFLKAIAYFCSFVLFTIYKQITFQLDREEYQRTIDKLMNVSNFLS